MILERNTRIIYRNIDGRGMLYDPDRRDVMTLNPAGAKLYAQLGEFTELETLLAETAGDDALIRTELEKFLGTLQKKGYLAGFSGEISGQELHQSDSDAQYGIGFSMSGTFSPGDKLVTAAVNTEQLSCGDVISFETSSGQRTAHRIIGGAPGAWQTMGDNNPAPDREIVTAAELFLVTAVVRGDREIAVPRGKAGMAKFRSWRRRRMLRIWTKKLLKIPFDIVVSCCFWRKKPERATDFGRLIQYSSQNRVIGWQIGSAPVYAEHKLKFFYRLPERD